jgi:hypothetical protein
MNILTQIKSDKNEEAANADLASKSQRKEIGPTQDELNATMLKNIADLSLKIEELGNAKPGMLKRLFGS